MQALMRLGHLWLYNDIFHELKPKGKNKIKILLKKKKKEHKPGSGGGHL